MFRLIALSLGIALMPSAGAPVKARPAAPPRKAIADPELEKAIRARFEKSKISKNRFQVRVQGGTATLDGETDIIQHKGTATRLAKAAGALKVVNRIRIGQAARDKAADNLAKGRRHAQIKRGEPRAEPASGR